MLKHSSRIALLLIALIVISIDVAGVTPRSTPAPNLVNYLSENTGWQVCKVLKVKVCVDCKQLPISMYKVTGECGNRKTTFITASIVHKNSNLLVANPYAKHLLMQEHSTNDVNNFPKTTIHKDNLGNFTSAFRIVSININKKSFRYALVSNFWSMDKIDSNAYGAIFKNLNMRLLCGPNECAQDQVNFFIISIEELNKSRSTHTKP